MAKQYGLRAGFALDLTVLDEDDGLPWDFDNPEKKAKAKSLVNTVKPKFLIGSPMCRAFSAQQGLNRHRMSEEKWNAILDHG